MVDGSCWKQQETLRFARSCKHRCLVQPTEVTNQRVTRRRIDMGSGPLSASNPARKGVEYQSRFGCEFVPQKNGLTGGAVAHERPLPSKEQRAELRTDAGPKRYRPAITNSNERDGIARTIERVRKRPNSTSHNTRDRAAKA
jgi:hypothetical protein